MERSHIWELWLSSRVIISSSFWSRNSELLFSDKKTPRYTPAAGRNTRGITRFGYGLNRYATARVERRKVCDYVYVDKLWPSVAEVISNFLHGCRHRKTGVLACVQTVQNWTGRDGTGRSDLVHVPLRRVVTARTFFFFFTQNSSVSYIIGAAVIAGLIIK